MILTERIHEAFQQLGWGRIPEILNQHAEEAAPMIIYHAHVSQTIV